MTPKYGKADLVQHKIVQALRQTGCSVAILTAVGGGFPDLLVARSGEMILCEVKTGEYGKLNEEQEAWRAKWKAPVHVVRTVDDALEAINDAVSKRKGDSGV